MSLIYNKIEERDYGIKVAISKVKALGCTIQVFNFILLIIDTISMVLEKTNHEQRWYFAFIPFGITVIAMICAFVELSAVNFFLTKKLNCIVCISVLNGFLQLGVHISFALSVTTNISQRGKYFMWGGVGVAALISTLIFSKAIFMCRFMRNNQDTGIDYGLMNDSQKKLNYEKQIFS